MLSSSTSRASVSILKQEPPASEVCFGTVVAATNFPFSRVVVKEMGQVAVVPTLAVGN